MTTRCPRCGYEIVPLADRPIDHEPLWLLGLVLGLAFIAFAVLHALA